VLQQLVLPLEIRLGKHLRDVGRATEQVSVESVEETRHVTTPGVTILCNCQLVRAH
jgi:hypothetical protein